jgi:hypothetical protein
VGVISNEIIPNETIAIIESSFVAGRIIESKNLFKVEEGMVVGAHYTLASVMQETKKFVESVKGKYLFIDPEIGYFVLAAKDLGVNFSQLHMVSDNVLNPHVENLSNERKKERDSGKK